MLVRWPKSIFVTISFKFHGELQMAKSLLCRRDVIFRQIRDSTRSRPQVSLLDLCACQPRSDDCFESLPDPSCRESKVFLHAVSRKRSRSTADQPDSRECGIGGSSFEPVEFHENVKY
jgi:hypothetical protein